MKFEKYIMYLVSEFKQILGLREYAITVEFSNGDGEGNAMTIKPEIDYLRALITAYPVCIKDYKDENYDDLIEYIIHEMAHILVEPLYLRAVNGITNQQVKDLDKDREQATQRITNILLRTLTLKKYYPNEHKPSIRRNKSPGQNWRRVSKVRKINSRVSSRTHKSRSSNTANRKRTRQNTTDRKRK